MTKPEFQEELNEKIRPGVKPSTLKKLKRSKSAGDIPKVPSLPTSVPISKSQSQQSFKDPQYPYTTLISQQQELEKLRKGTETKSTTISLLRKKIAELETQSNSEPTNTELDQSLIARHQNLKDWFTQFKKNKKLDQELAENIDKASTELLEQDKVISQLRGQVSKLKQEKESLARDLQLASRLAESRKVPYFANENNWTYLKYALYSLGAVLFTLWLTNNLRKENK